METKHTPGPWNIVESNKVDEESHIQTDLKSICRLWIQMDGQDMANARLIAAAPELLDALKDARNAYQQMFDVMPVAWQTIDNIICDAISKATGE